MALNMLCSQEDCEPLAPPPDSARITGLACYVHVYEKKMAIHNISIVLTVRRHGDDLYMCHVCSIYGVNITLINPISFYK